MPIPRSVDGLSRGSLAVLCVISIAAVLLFFFAEETWQLPLRSTRPVSQHPVCYCALLIEVRVEEKKLRFVQTC